jgi:hypothetical protein
MALVLNKIPRIFIKSFNAIEYSRRSSVPQFMTRHLILYLQLQKSENSNVILEIIIL